MKLPRSCRPSALWVLWVLLWAWGGARLAHVAAQAVHALVLTVDAASRALTGPLPGRGLGSHPCEDEAETPGRPAGRWGLGSLGSRA